MLAAQFKDQKRNGKLLDSADLRSAGYLATVPGGHGTEYFKGDWFDKMPETARKSLSEDFVRTPHTPEEARAQVEALKKRGVDAIKAVMEACQPSKVPGA